MSAEEITAAQLRLRQLHHPVHSPGWYARLARWWKLEARRGYPSSGLSLTYYSNMRWAAEAARAYGDLPWTTLRLFAEVA